MPIAVVVISFLVWRFDNSVKERKCQVANEGFRQVALRPSTVELVRQVASKMRPRDGDLVVNRATGEPTLDSAIAALCAQWLRHQSRSKRSQSKRTQG